MEQFSTNMEEIEMGRIRQSIKLKEE